MGSERGRRCIVRCVVESAVDEGGKGDLVGVDRVGSEVFEDGLVGVVSVGDVGDPYSLDLAVLPLFYFDHLTRHPSSLAGDLLDSPPKLKLSVAIRLPDDRHLVRTSHEEQRLLPEATSLHPSLFVRSIPHLEPKEDDIVCREVPNEPGGEEDGNDAEQKLWSALYPFQEGRIGSLVSLVVARRTGGGAEGGVGCSRAGCFEGSERRRSAGTKYFW